jgi:excisionase family DNA binding protein
MFGRPAGLGRRSLWTQIGRGEGERSPSVFPQILTAILGNGNDHEVEHMQPRDDDALLTPSEVAAMFRVNPKTVTRWARAGKISAIRTLGGHRRFRASEIRQFLEQVEQTEQL